MYPKNILLQKNHLLSLTLALLATLVMGLLWPNLALADGPITVTTTIDEFNIGTDCSLREAIQTANHDSDFGGCTHSGTAPYTIILTDGTYVLTNTGTGDDANIQGDLDISATMTISGTGANKTIINGNTSDRVFHIASSGVATLSHLSVVSGTTTLLIGSCPDDDLCGGGAYVGTGGALTVLTSTFSSNTAAVGGGGIFNYQGSVAMTNTTFSSNTARMGGGIYNYQGNVDMTNTTVSSNTATKGGGGIFNAPQSNVDMTNTTFSHNQADGGFGGAIYNDSVMTMTHNTLSDNIVNGRFNDTPYGVIDNDGTMYLRNNIVANSTTSGGGNCTSSETLAEDSYNLMEGGGCGVPVSTSDPLLGPLVDNGGDTQTHALLSGSPALDAAVCLAGFTTDQRGQPRPSGGTCDIGSYEAAFDLSIIKTVNPSTAAPDETITYTLTFSNSGSATASGVIITDSIPVSVATSSVISSGVAITQTSSGYVWAVQDLAPTEGGVITITGVLSTSLAEGAFTNTATIGSNSVDSDPANNSDSAGVTIPPSNVGINKTVTPATAAPGETITYTLTFSNSGYATASGIIITDSIPISVTTSSVISSGVAITQTASGYVWAVQDLARNEGGVITITGVLSTSLADGAFTNTATISSTSTDSDTGNNSNSAGVTVGESGGVYLPIIIKN